LHRRHQPAGRPLVNTSKAGTVNNHQEPQVLQCATPRPIGELDMAGAEAVGDIHAR
jgi:hypothetical protein